MKNLHNIPASSEDPVYVRHPIVPIAFHFFLIVVTTFMLGNTKTFAQEAQVYYTDNTHHEIWRGPLDGTNQELVLKWYVLDPIDIALDPEGGKIYWADTEAGAGYIRRANLDGSEIEDVLREEWFSIDNIALDLVHDKIYWASGWSNLDGTDRGDFDLGISIEDLVVDPVAGRLYLMSGEDIQRADLNGENMEVFIPDLLEGGVLVLDPATSRLYWWDRANKVIRSINPDGSDMQDVLSLPDADVISLTIDAQQGAIYWLDDAAGQMGRARLNGSNLRIFLENQTEAVNIALDTSNREVYWVEPNRIRKARINGTNVADVRVSEPNQPTELVVDIEQERMYWFDKGTDQVRKANLDGSDVQDVFATPLTDAGDLILDPVHDRLYWVLYTEGIIRRANLDGSALEDVLTLGPDRLAGYVIEPELGNLYWFDPSDYMVYRAGLDGSNPEAISAPDFPGIYPPGWAVAQRFVGVDSERDRMFLLASIPNDAQGLIRTRLDGSEPSQVASITVFKGGVFKTVTLSPDKKLLYVVDDTGGSPALQSRGNSLAVYSPEGNSLVEFTDLVRTWLDRLTDVAFDWRYITYPGELSIEGFSLINRATGWTLPGFESLAGSIEIDLNLISYPEEIAIKANAAGPAESVRFEFMGDASFHIDNAGPFTALSLEQVQNGFQINEGTYTLVATPYAEDDAAGEAVTSMAIDITFVDKKITFTLIDAGADEVVPGYDPMTDDAILDMSQLPAELSIQANVADNVESVLFAFDGNPVYRIENESPYTLFGDFNGDYGSVPADMNEGTHALTATAYAADNAQGEVLDAESITFTLASGTTITGFTLVNADTGADVLALEEGTTLGLDALPAHLNVRADVLSEVGSVHFVLEPDGFVHSESVPPFALFGDIDGDYVDGTFSVGNHTLRATPYKEPGLSGTQGAEKRVAFTVVQNAAFSKAPAAGGEEERIDTEAVPVEYNLYQNYPNPFNPVTQIRFALPEATHVEMIIYDVTGRQVAKVVDGTMTAGWHTVHFDAGHLPSGLYLYRLKAGRFEQTERMALMK